MIDSLEAMLRPPALKMAPYAAKSILLASGESMVVRQASVDEVDALLEAIDPLKKLSRDFYDIVSARLYAELLGWKVHRVRNEYCLVGVIDGELAGIVNGRMFDEKHGISYHTLTLKRGLRVGATGVSQIAELVFQLRGEAGKRQVKDAKHGFALNFGGFGNNVVATILSRGQ